MYSLILLYWDWILILVLIGSFSGLIYVLNSALWFLRAAKLTLPSGSCQGCSDKGTGGTRDRVASRIEFILNGPNTFHESSDNAFSLSDQRDDWLHLFDDCDMDNHPTYSQLTPLGKVLLLKGIRAEWLRSSCESSVFEAVLAEQIECWMITLSHPLRQGRNHPLVKEYLVAGALVDVGLCPDPIYLSGPRDSVYASFTEVEERYMLYGIPAGSEFLTQWAFRQEPPAIKELCLIFSSLTRVVKEFHACGLAHGALDDDAVVVSDKLNVVLINFSKISTQVSNQYADIVAVINLFGFLVSGGFCRTVSEFCSRIVKGLANVNRSSIIHFRELELLTNIQLADPYEKIMVCLDGLRHCQ